MKTISKNAAPYEKPAMEILEAGLEAALCQQSFNNGTTDDYSREQFEW